MAKLVGKYVSLYLGSDLVERVDDLTEEMARQGGKWQVHKPNRSATVRMLLIKGLDVREQELLLENNRDDVI